MLQQRIGSAAFIVLVSAVSCASGVHAQSWGLPETVDAYRFLPRRSIVNQQGGIAGFDVDYRVRGTFDFRIQQSPLAIYPPVHVATFENVDAVGLNPKFGDIDVDAAFNLSGIHGGERLIHPRVPGLFYFQGKTGDGSSVSLHAKVEGRWLYLRGRTMAPEGSADFFEYTIKALARRLPDGDFNSDGKVDGDDLIGWSGGSFSGRDLLAWQRQLGEEAPSIESLDASLDAAIAAAAASSVAAIPEPAAFVLVSLAAGIIWCNRRRGSS